MLKNRIFILSAIAIAIFIIDQAIKQIFLDGFRWDGEYVSLILTFNKGVAFSMFAFLGAYLKYIQVALIIAVLLYVLYDKQLLHNHTIPFGIIIGAGCGNIYDRFIHEGVVDYVFWHKWFEFAVFNFADVMIDIAVGILILQTFLWNKKYGKT